MSKSIIEELKEIVKHQAQEQAEISRQLAKEQADISTKQRQLERSEDLVKYTEVIEKCIDSKIESALNPVKEKQNNLERETRGAIGELSARLITMEK